MKKLIAPLLLSIITVANASAAWVEVARNDETVAYIDFGTLRKSGQIRDVWMMHDYSSQKSLSDKERYMSAKFKERVDCGQDKTQLLAAVFYSGNMGDGDVVYSNSYEAAKWQHTVPSSMAEATSRSVCRR